MLFNIILKDGTGDRIFCPDGDSVDFQTRMGGSDAYSQTFRILKVNKGVGFNRDEDGHTRFLITFASWLAKPAPYSDAAIALAKGLAGDRYIQDPMASDRFIDLHCIGPARYKRFDGHQGKLVDVIESSSLSMIR